MMFEGYHEESNRAQRKREWFFQLINKKRKSKLLSP